MRLEIIKVYILYQDNCINLFIIGYYLKIKSQQIDVCMEIIVLYYSFFNNLKKNDIPSFNLLRFYCNI